MESNPKLEKLKVLLVNDEQVSLMALEIIFTRSIGVKKQNIKTAMNGLEAYNLSISQHFDLIVMDLSMPIMNGFESCLKIKTYYEDSNIYVSNLKS